MHLGMQEQRKMLSQLLPPFCTRYAFFLNCIRGLSHREECRRPVITPVTRHQAGHEEQKPRTDGDPETRGFPLKLACPPQGALACGAGGCQPLRVLHIPASTQGRRPPRHPWPGDG